MVTKLTPVPINGNLKIVRILGEGFDKFNNVVHNYCNQNGSLGTILDWGTEKTLLSMFSQGLNKKNRNCFLELSFDAIKKAGKSKIEYKRRMVDAYLCDRTVNNKTLTAIIEAKAVNPYIEEEPADGNVGLTKNAVEEAKSQLEDIEPENIYINEELGSENHVYRIALVFTILRAKFAESGEGDNLNWYDYKDILYRADNFFKQVVNKNNEENILHYKYIHSKSQLELIKQNYSSEMDDGYNMVDRPHKNTYYKVGALVTAAFFE